jgi:hypothetical protein
LEATHSATLPVHPELPFTAGITTITLTPDQERDLLPLVQRQVIDRRGLLFFSVAPFMDVEAGSPALRLQAVFLPWKIANRVLKLIREANQPSAVSTLKNADTSCAGR